MTAYRVIEDHKELENSGAVPHSTLDAYANTTPYLVVNGVTGSLPPAARFLTAGTGISIVDGGPGGNVVLTATGDCVYTVPRTAWMESPSGACDGTNDTFELAYAPVPTTSLMLYRNGVLQKQNSDYILASATTIVFARPPEDSSKIFATYVFQVPQDQVGLVSAWMEVPSGSIDGVNDTFGLLHKPDPPQSLRMFVNGVFQRPGISNDYVLSSSTVTFSISPLTGSNLLSTYTYRNFAEQGKETNWMDFPIGSTDGSNVVFTLTNTPLPPESLMFYVDGILQEQGIDNDYVLAGTTVTMNYPPTAGTNIMATYPFSS